MIPQPRDAGPLWPLAGRVFAQFIQTVGMGNAEMIVRHMAPWPWEAPTAGDLTITCMASCDHCYAASRRHSLPAIDRMAMPNAPEVIGERMGVEVRQRLRGMIEEKKTKDQRR